MEPQPEWVVLFGIGTGQLLDSLLRQSPQIRLIVVEIERGLVQQALSHYGWQQTPNTQKIIFLLPDISSSEFEQISAREVQLQIQHYAEDAPLLWAFGESHAMHEKFYAAIQTKVQLAVSRRANHGLSIQTKVDVLVVSPRCAIFNDIAAVLSSMGLQCKLLTVPDVEKGENGQAWLDAYQQLLTIDAKFVITRNRSLFQELSDEIQTPERNVSGKILHWWWDVPNVASRMDHQLAVNPLPQFGFARDILPLLPAGSTWLPPAARSQFVLSPEDECFADQDIEVSFVGQSRLPMIQQCLSVIIRHLQPIDEAFATHFKSVITQSELAVAKLPEIYRRSKVNMNLNFMQVSSTVNSKVLDAAAMGATIITDYRPELDELFPDAQCRPAAFKELNELADLVGAELAKDQQEKRASLLTFTRSQHRLEHRLNQLLGAGK